MNGRKLGVMVQTSAVDDKQRLKRWAPRARTGCGTCRRRRVKCDEVKPICGQCVTTRNYCTGPYYQDSAACMPSKKDNMAAVLVRRATTAPKSVRPTNYRGWEIIPAGWDVVEAHEYLGLEVIPYMMNLNLMSADKVGPLTLCAVPGSTNAEAFLARVHADRIVAVSSSQHLPLSPSTSCGTAHLWTRFCQLIGQHLQQVNRDITGDVLDHLLKKRVFERICDLMEAEHVLCLPGWRAHMNGYFVLLLRFGIPVELPASNPCFVDSLRSMITYATVGNSVSNLKHQLPYIYEFDDDELVSIFGKSSFPAFPCPSKLFSEIVAINRLRLNAQKCKIGLTAPEATAILGRVKSFDAPTWTKQEKFSMPNIPEVPLMARIFQLSVGLYGLLSLDLNKVDRAEMNWPSRNVVLTELLTLMRRAWKYPKCRNVLVWPAAVAGVALARGPAESQHFITECLAEVDAGMLGYGIAATTLTRLQAFWESQKTGWEDCWKEFYLLF